MPQLTGGGIDDVHKTLSQINLKTSGSEL
jgi:hypothetical protein